MKSELFSPYPVKGGLSFPPYFFITAVKEKLVKGFKNYKVKMYLFFNTQRSTSLFLYNYSILDSPSLSSAAFQPILG